MLARLVDRVQDRKQPGQHGGDRLLPHGGPVPVHALAVVGVLGLQALQVGGALREPRLGVGRLRSGGGRVLDDPLEDLLGRVGRLVPATPLSPVLPALGVGGPGRPGPFSVSSTSGPEAPEVPEAPAGRRHQRCRPAWMPRASPGPAR